MRAGYWEAAHLITTPRASWTTRLLCGHSHIPLYPRGAVFVTHSTCGLYYLTTTISPPLTKRGLRPEHGEASCQPCRGYNETKLASTINAAEKARL